MKKAVIATLMLLLCSVWTLAQQSDPPNPSGNAAKTATIQGCLNRSGNDYTLTDKAGKTYKLSGDTSQLSAHVGHEVQIMGSKDAHSAMGAQGTEAQLNVTGMKHISETCSSAPQTGNTTAKPPMSEKPPQ
jgi:hypothetical protein